MLVIQYEGEYENFLQLKTSALTLLLKTMFCGINETMNYSYEVWRWLHQKYVMIQIVQNYIWSRKKTALALLLPIMFDWIDNTMNESDEVWRYVHQRYVMSKIVLKLHSIKKLILTCCYQWCLVWFTKQWMIVMQYESECIKNMELFKSYKNGIR